MKRGATQSSRLAAITGACIVVLGRPLVIPASATRGLPVVTLDPGRLADVDVAALVIADLGAHEPAVLAEALRLPALEGAPVLLFAPAEPAPETLERLGASDVLLTSTPPAIASRRIGALVELGLGRLSISIAEQALEHSVNGLTVADVSTPDAPLVYVSPVFETLTGFSIAEATGKNCRLLLRGERDQPGMALLRQAIKNRSRATAVVQNHKRDGAAFWNEVTIFPVTLNGRPTRWMAGVQHDVTVLREAQAAITELCNQLADQQLFSQAILDGIDVGIVTTDAGGTVTFANRVARALLQLDEVRGEKVESVLGLEAPPALVLGDEGAVARSHAVPARDGSLIELDLTLTRGELAHDARVGFFVIVRDARAARELEAERHRFEHLVTMGTMVAGFAHEVRNPVAALRSIAEELDEEQQTVGLKLPHVGQMLKLLARIERLVQTSLQYGRPAAPRPSRHRPWALLSSALSTLGPRIRGHRGDVRIEVAPELPDLHCDDGQIVQALVVLLDNALDSTGDPTRVLLRVTADRLDEQRARKSQPPPAFVEPNAVRIDVVDDGPGVPSEIAARIFDPFFTTKAQGTGLGLPIAQQLVRDNRGRLELTSPRGGPTTFSILLPTIS